MSPLVLVVPDAAAMEALGEALAAELRVGDLVLLHGELGAGKTTLTRGIGRGLGVRGAVTSPTFVLARTHPRADGPPLVHVDAYRLPGARDLDDLDLDLDGSITVVEWGVGKLTAESYLEITIERPTGSSAPDPGDPDADEPRTVTIARHGPRWSGSGP